MNCPSCSSANIKRNGRIHNGKQNYKCTNCGRQFVEDPQNKIIADKTKTLIEKLLLERVSLAGICRIAEVSKPWLQKFIGQLYGQQPDDLHAYVPTAEAMAQHLENRFDELACEVSALKKTLIRLSKQHHGRILGHLKLKHCSTAR